MFEDIGHSSEARTVMKKYLVGSLKVNIQFICNLFLTVWWLQLYSYQFDPSKVKAKKTTVVTDEKSRGGLNPFAVIVLLLAIAAGIVFNYFQPK